MEQHHRTSLGLLVMFVIYCQDFRNSRASVWGKQWPQLRGPYSSFIGDKGGPVGSFNGKRTDFC